MKKRSFGYIESGFLSSDAVYSASSKSLPDKYELADQLGVYDQGSLGSCVSCTVAEMYHFYKQMRKLESDIPREYVYKKRADKKIDGMMPREAFEILRSEDKIRSFARINSLPALQSAVLANGAALIGLIARSYDSDFWNGSTNYGGHAVAVVGWDKEGLLIKNSWGTYWGQGGYTILPYQQFDKIREAWTIIG